MISSNQGASRGKQGGRPRGAGPAASPGGAGKVQTEAKRELGRDTVFWQTHWPLLQNVGSRDGFTLNWAMALLRKAATWRPSKDITEGL